MAEVVDSVKVSTIVDNAYSGDANPEWVNEAFDKDEFLLVNTTVRLKVGKDEVYARSVDTITIDSEQKFGVVRGPEFV